MADFFGKEDKIFPRTSRLSESNSFFVFGARGTGKSTLIRSRYRGNWWIDLLDQKTEDQYLRHPDRLYEEIERRHFDKTLPEWVVIDEIQKIPRLLDVVHRSLESQDFKPPKFILTGSSPRKLKHGGANLLAGRAVLRHMEGLTSSELGARFDLEHALAWGTLPLVAQATGDEADILESYVHTYIQEEIKAEVARIRESRRSGRFHPSFYTPPSGS